MVAVVRRDCWYGANGQPICRGNDDNTGQYVGSGIGIFLAILLFILLVICLSRRKRRRQMALVAQEGMVAPPAYHAGQMASHRQAQQSNPYDYHTDYPPAAAFAAKEGGPYIPPSGPPVDEVVMPVLLQQHEQPGVVHLQPGTPLQPTAPPPVYDPNR